MRLQLLLILLLPISISYAQEISISSCHAALYSTSLHGNEVSARLNSSGDMFWDGDEASYEVPFGENIHSLFAQALWMGGLDPGGNLKLAAQTYGKSSGQSDYFSGPLSETGEITTEECQNWDYVWCVSRYDIIAHLEDFEDGTLNNPITTLLEWPGKGNPHFEDIWGFPLPDTPQGLAPFFDQNADGLYDPFDGDYPIVPQVDIIPEQLCWNVINDAGNLHASSQGEPLQMEIQITSWAHNCADNPQLNKTIFLSYKLISRAIEQIDSMYLGIWNDFDLGCYTDDYIGYHEATKSVFVYNQDNIDGENASNCPGGVQSYGENPPVQAATFLNRPLAYGMYFNNSGLGGVPATNDPNTTLEYYHLLSGRWRDGSPLETGGDGYNEGTEPTNIAFPGDPNNPDEWSALSANLPAGDRRTVSSVYIGQMLPGQVETVDIAYSFFRAPDANFLQNVTAMYEGLEDLQEWYSNGFSTACSTPDLCTDDCVWAGDLNADGIANYCDLIAIDPYIGSLGTTRSAPYNWSPQDSESWAIQQENNADIKHQDGNGDGLIAYDDFFLTDIHYGLTNPSYTPAPTVIFEAEDRGLSLEGVISPLENLEAGSSILTRINIEGYVPLHSLGFIMEYDPIYFERVTNISANGFNLNNLEVIKDLPDQGELHYAKVATEEDGDITDGIVIIIVLKVKDDLQNVPSNSTTVRFINTKAYDVSGLEVMVESQNKEVTFAGVTDTENILADNQYLKLFPNPAKEELQIEGDLHMITPIQVFSASGQLLRTVPYKGEEIQTIPLSGLPKGLYFLRVSTDEGVMVKRFIKK